MLYNIHEGTSREYLQEKTLAAAEKTQPVKMYRIPCWHWQHIERTELVDSLFTAIRFLYVR